MDAKNSKNNVIGIGDQFLTGIIDNNPNLRSDPSSSKHYKPKVATNYIGIAAAPIQPVMQDTGSWDGMTFTYTYTVRTNVGTLVVIAAPTGGFPNNIGVDTVTSGEDPSGGDYPSPNTPVGLEFSDGEQSGPSFSLSLGYDATSIATPTVNITATSTKYQTITDNIKYLTHTWNGKVRT